MVGELCSCYDKRYRGVIKLRSNLNRLRRYLSADLARLVLKLSTIKTSSNGSEKETDFFLSDKVGVVGLSFLDLCMYSSD